MSFTKQTEEKRTRTPTSKGIIMAMERLQMERSGKFKQATKLKNEINSLITSSENVSEVQRHLKEIKLLCSKAVELHHILLSEFPMPEEEQDKQNAWLQSKLTSCEMFIDEISKWLDANVLENEGDNTNEVFDNTNEVLENANEVENANEGDYANKVFYNANKVFETANEGDNTNMGLENANECNNANMGLENANECDNLPVGFENANDDGKDVQDEISPEDSVSNTSRGSRRSKTSSRSSAVAYACTKAKAEQAALMAKAAALKRRHELETEEENLRLEREKLRKRKEQMELDAEISAAAAKISVLEGSDVGRKSTSHATSSHVSKGFQRKCLTFNPKAQEFVPKHTPTVTQRSTDLPIFSTYDVRPKVNMRFQVQAQQHGLSNAKDATVRPNPQISTALPILPTSDAQPNVHSHVQSQQHGLLQAKDVTVRQYSEINTGPPYTANLRNNTTSLNVNTVPTAVLSRPTQEQNTNGLHSVQNNTSLHASAQNTMDQNICGILQKQNDITSMLMQQQMSATLPQREMTIFDGDPLHYISFIRTFEHCVESKASTYHDCLYYLEQYTKGQPRALVRSCLHMASQQGYEKAKELLKEHFGNEYIIAAAYMDKAFGWPAIKGEDLKALQEFALFLRGCCNAMVEIQYMEEMNTPSHMRQIMLKWPYKLRERWRTKACAIQEQQHCRATFPDMVSFLESQVKVLSHPLFGDISDTRASASLQSRPSPRSHVRESSFATTIAATNHTELTRQDTANQSVASKDLSSELCLYCGELHLLLRCSELNKISQKEKIEFLKTKGICFGCLKPGHINKQCRGRLVCDECHLNHPTILHVHNQDKLPVSSALVSLQTYGCTGAGDQDCTLSIVPVQLKSKRGDKVVQTYAFLDPGSTATFCTNRLVRKLNLQGTHTNILLRTLGQESVVNSQILTGLEVSKLDSNEFVDLPETFTHDTIPVSRSNIPTQRDIDKWDYLKNVKIPTLDADVEMLIGTNVPKLMEPWEIINSQGDGPYAVRTLLGWVINGPLRGSGGYQKGCSTVYANRISIARLEELLVSQYNQDFNEKTLEEKHEMSREDLKFMEILDRSTCMLEGHYSMDLPFKEDDIIMPNNRCIVEQRLQGLKRKFKKNKTYQEEYTAFITDIINSGYAEVVPQDQAKCKEGSLWYLPHHGVYHPKKKTLRVVFDCGAVFKGTSLNGRLLQGPDFTNSLFGVLTRFRQENIALMTDVKAMYHQVKVSEKHVNFLRFLWWPQGDISQKPVEHRMRVHIFGAVSSPSCANYALRRTAMDNKDNFNVEVTDTIYNNFYVDDCLKSKPTNEQAIQLVTDLTDLCSRGGFQLVKWTSNSRAVLSSIPEERRSKTTRQLRLEQEDLPVEMALGLNWCAESDTFTFKPAVENRPHSRRGILSIVSSIYDPLGFLAPFTLIPKLLLQEMCRKNMSWDDPIPQVFSLQWTGWLLDLERVAELKVNRCIKPKGFRGPIHGQLHHFADASDHGYGTVSYLRLENQDKEVHMAFMLGKARVAPLKQTTIPRLELTAAVLAVKVDRMLRNEMPLDLEESCFWTDSQTVLKYINNDTKRFHTFVANRVASIRETTKVTQWRYIGSKNNPADEASRGLTADNFIACRRWISGPDFLQKPRTEWLRPFDLQPINSDDPEVKRELMVNVVIAEAEDATSRLVKYFSGWTKLKTSVAWFLKIKAILLELSKRRKKLIASLTVDGLFTESEKVEKEMKKTRAAVGNQSLSVTDLARAESAIICLSQQETFGEEIDSLRSGASGVKKSSNICRLDPVLKDGLLRVGGRLSRVALPEESKHPVILSKGTHVSHLILQFIHRELGHAGRNHMLSSLRRKYWITNANSACRKVLSDCVTCRRYRGQASEQKMADMPKERITPDLPPFTNVGVDYFGPIEVKRGRAVVKRYGVIFTCMTSRAIHLEVAYSLNTDSCINAVRRFMCRRGQVRHLRSDNGTNFVGAERELREALSAIDHSKIQSALLQKGIDWSFNTPGASHHGGVWERLIRMVRKVLFSVLQQQSLDDESLHTILCEVEAILNDRPITKVSDDVNDLEALTPNHILLLKGKPLLAPGLFQENDLYIRRRWRQVQYLSDLFWKRWTREYLPLLQERQKWTKPMRSYMTGDLVVVMDQNAPRGSWILGKVIKTYPDKKGFVRSVQLKTKTGHLERPISKLFLLQEAM